MYLTTFIPSNWNKYMNIGIASTRGLPLLISPILLKTNKQTNKKPNKPQEESKLLHSGIEGEAKKPKSKSSFAAC